MPRDITHFHSCAIFVSSLPVRKRSLVNRQRCLSPGDKLLIRLLRALKKYDVRRTQRYVSAKSTSDKMVRLLRKYVRRHGYQLVHSSSQDCVLCLKISKSITRLCRTRRQRVPPRGKASQYAFSAQLEMHLTGP